MPAKGFSGFHHDPLTNSVGEYFFFVSIALLVLEVNARHRDHAHFFALCCELLCGLDAEVEFGAGTDQNEIGGSCTVLQDISA